MSLSVVAPRGCGTRIKGGIYATTKLSDYGAPVESFLVEPTERLAIDGAALGVSHIGVKVMQWGESWHVFDWVGAQHYPNVTDFIEEARQLGVSRRLPNTLDFVKLDNRSRLYLIHDRAYIRNYADYYQKTEWQCPKKNLGHFGTRVEPATYPHAFCGGLWYEDADGIPEQTITREMPSFTYRTNTRPAGLEPDYRPAIFMCVPINDLEVVRDPEGKSHVHNFTVAQLGRIPVTLVDA